MEPLNTYRAGADENGKFGIYGGRFVAETLMPLILEVERAYEESRNDPAFAAEMSDYLAHYVGRPSPLYFARRLTHHLGGAKIYLKREDLNHTGAHKINSCIGQILLARRMGKTRIIAETGAGQHGVATATVCALFDLPCVVYMGVKDIERQAPNVLPHGDAGGRGETGDGGLGEPQGRPQRSASRLGGQRGRHLLHHRHRRRPPSLPDHGAGLPDGHRRRGARHKSWRPRAGSPTPWSPASAAVPTPWDCSIPSSTTRVCASSPWRRPVRAWKRESTPPA